MNDKSKRSEKTPHKKGADSHDPAVKHDKVAGSGHRSKDIHEDRGTRPNKLGKPRR